MQQSLIEILSVEILSNIPRLFIPENDDSNIEQVVITALEGEGVRILVTGKNTPLKADIVNLPVGFAFDIQKTNIAQNPENDIEIIATGEREAEAERNIVPQVEIRRQEILDRPNRRLGDVIQQLPGILMDGPPGENKDVRLRGLDKEFTRLQVDGVTLPDGGEKREFQTNRLPSFFVDNVRVIRNSSAEFEGDGIAGRIAVDTIPIPDVGEYIFEGRVGYGGQNTLTGGYWDIPLVLGERQTENFGFVTGLNYGRNPIDVDKIKTFSDGKTETEREFKDQTFKNGLLKVGYFYDQGEIILQPLALSFEELKDKTKINETPATKPNEKPKIDRDEEKENQSRDTWGIGIEHNHRFDNGIALASKMGYYTSGENKDKTIEKFKQDIFDKTQLEKENKQDSIWNFTNNVTIPIKGDISQEIKLGVAFRFRDRFRDKTREEIDKKGKIKDITEGKDNYNITENYFAGFIQNQIFITDSFSILPGVRIEHVDLTTGTKGNISDVSKSITDVLPSLHFLYQPIPDLNLNLAFSRSLNRPKFDELSPFVDDKGDRLVIGNPELNPARSWNIDVGGKYENQYVVFGVNFFQRWIDGVIEEVAIGETINRKDIFQVQNVGDGWTNGFELEQRLNFGFTKVEGLKALTLWANQTFLSSELEVDTHPSNQRL